MKRLFLLTVTVFSILVLSAQVKNAEDSSYIVELNQQIDNLVVQRNVTALDTLYADDFVFSHGTGLVEGKASWLTAVAKNTYPLRKHDSVTAEVHPGVAVVKGKMQIQRTDTDKTARYTLKYIRVYALRNKRWQLISHNTTYEQHEQ